MNRVWVLSVYDSFSQDITIEQGVEPTVLYGQFLTKYNWDTLFSKEECDSFKVDNTYRWLMVMLELQRKGYIAFGLKEINFVFPVRENAKFVAQQVENLVYKIIMGEK